MDINDMRSAGPHISRLMFVGIMAWTWQRSRKAQFDEAARLPFADETDEPSTGVKQ
jgi:cytochrome c oxidase cbb3-type subunit IV